MSSQTLREARSYEEVAEKAIPAEEKPAFHLSPRVGWMNDPNGFSWYQGKYHLFYQYHPYATQWGPMHWGHAVTTDFLHWEHCPAALAPDELYDCDGCFSGSAAVLPDGRQLLMYTGVQCERSLYGERVEIQTQCLAVGDGCNYEKYEGNPVLTGKDLPEGSSIHDFRDPRLLQRQDGTYDCFVGSRPADGSGQILLYHSDDGFHWTFRNVIIKNRNRFGKMWECPDFFELDGKWVLLTSPQDMLPSGFEYHNGNGTLCLIGSYDEERMVFEEETDHAVDYGIDFYAPQTVLTPDGRRVMIGWMQNWDTVLQHRTVKMNWYGQMSLPRELHIRDGRLFQWPVRELEKYRCQGTEFHEDSFSGKKSFPGVSGRTADFEVEIAPADGADIYRSFSIQLAQNEEYHTTLSFHPSENILKIDRKYSGSRRAIIHQRRAQINADQGVLKLRIVLDRYSMEIFVNGGEQVLTASIFTDLSADGIVFSASGEIKLHGMFYRLDMDRQA